MKLLQNEFKSFIPTAYYTLLL